MKLEFTVESDAAAIHLMIAFAFTKNKSIVLFKMSGWLLDLSQDIEMYNHYAVQLKLIQ